MQKDTQVQKLHFLVERLLDFSTCMAPEMMVSGWVLVHLKSVKFSNREVCSK